MMKKALVLLLVLCMVLSLCACGSSGDPDSGKETESTESTTAQNQSGQEGESLKEEGTTTESELVTAAKTILGTAISLDADYALVYEDEDIVYFSLVDGEYAQMDYTVYLEDGTAMKLPTAYTELTAAGWTSRSQWEEVEAQSAGYDWYTNSDGKTIQISFLNAGSEPIPVEETTITGIDLGSRLGCTAGYQICGISEGSTVAEVTAALGKPNEIHYQLSSYNGEPELELIYASSNVYGHLTFYIDGQGSLVTGVSYSGDR